MFEFVGDLLYVRRILGLFSWRDYVGAIQNTVFIISQTVSFYFLKK